MDVGRNLTVMSKQNAEQSSSWGFDVTVGFGSASASVSASEGERNFTDNLTTLVGQKGVNINVAGNTHLEGALIANIKEDDTDGGNLRLNTNTLTFADLADNDDYKSITISGGYSSGGGAGGGGQVAGAAQPSGASPYDKSMGISYDYRDVDGVTRATIGKGDIIIRDEKNQQQDVADLNRDIDNVQAILKDNRTQFEITIPLNLTSEARENASRNIDRNTRKVINEINGLYAQIFPNGLSPENRSKFATAAVVGDTVQLEALIEGLKGELSASDIAALERFKDTQNAMELIAGLSPEGRAAATFEVGVFFDGTGNNKDAPSGDTKETSVAILHDSYTGEGGAIYEAGVATNGFLDYYVCGLIGCGSYARMEDASTQIERRYQQLGDGRILLLTGVGFSRGAATNLTYANIVENDGIGSISPSMIAIGTLANFDTVGSFGIPGNNIDPGQNFVIASTVGTAIQAVSEHETRRLFDLQSFGYSDGTYPSNVIQQIFPGVHSDIGFAYINDPNGLSNELGTIPLSWMHQQLTNAGVPLAPLSQNNQPSSQMTALYNNYVTAKTAYEANPTPQNAANYSTVYNQLRTGYIHDETMFFDAGNIRDVYYPNDATR